MNASKTITRKDEKKLKSIYEFDCQADPNKNPLHIVYSCVTFSEIKTFDLMCLLQSFRKWNNDIFQYTSDFIGTDEYILNFIEAHSPYYDNDSEKKKQAIIDLRKFDFSDVVKSHVSRTKYYKALKTELSKRRNLTPHEKRAINKKY